MLNRLTRNSRNFMILGLILALIVIVLVYALLSKQTQPNGTSANSGPLSSIPIVSAAPTATALPYTVVVATTDLYTPTVMNLGGTIDKYFTVMPTMRKPITYTNPISGQFATLDDLKAYVDITNTYNVRTIPGGLPVLTGMMKPMGNRQMVSLSLNVPPQRVAGSVTLSALASANNQVVAGDFVDIMATIPSNSVFAFVPPNLPANPQTNPADYPKTWPNQTQTVLQNVPVLAVSAGGSGSIYTLALNHQDALLIKYLKDNSINFELALRSSADETAPAFSTEAILPQYLTTKLKSKFQVLRAPFAQPPSAANNGQ